MSWNLDLSTVDENDGGEKKTWAPLPKGSYKVILTGCDVDAEEKTSKKGAKYRSAKLTLQVLEGEHANRLIFYSVIIQHETSELAQRIGQTLLKKIAVATGAPEQLTPSNIGELLNKPFVAVLDVEEGREYTDANGVDQKYPDRNRVLDAKKSGAAAPAPKPKSDAPAWLQA